MKLYIESKDQLLERTADGRGRITLGSQYADQDVTLAVIDADGDQHDYTKSLQPTHEKREIIGKTEDGKLIFGDSEPLETADD